MSNQGSVFPPGHTRPPDNVVETSSSKKRRKEDEDRNTQQHETYMHLRSRASDSEIQSLGQLELAEKVAIWQLKELTLGRHEAPRKKMR